eukprot:1302602-Heterocapsa_arctica.AAC.1
MAAKARSASLRRGGNLRGLRAIKVGEEVALSRSAWTQAVLDYCRNQFSSTGAGEVGEGADL